MSFIGNALSDVASVASNVLGPVAGPIGDLLAPFTGGTSAVVGNIISGGSSIFKALSGGGGGSLVDGILGGVGHLLSGAKDGLGTLFSDIGGGVESLFKGAFSDLMNHAGTILTGINKEVASISKTVDGVVKPIATGINEITATVRNINDNLIHPVVSLVTTTEQEVNNVLASIHQDLHSGIKGFLQLPQDLTNALGSVDAQFSRATQQLGMANQSIVTEHLVPGLTAGIGKPLEGMDSTLSGPVFTEETNAVFEQLVNIGESSTAAEALATVKAFDKTISGTTGFFAPIIKYVWHLLRMGTFLVDSLQPVEVQILQEARATQPVELLGADTVIEAQRRGLLSAEDSKGELLKQGLSESRQQVLYDLAQFLFSPSQAWDLWFRGIISDAERDQLMSQNNLDTGQAAAMRQLMEHILGPGDIMAALARGYVTEDEARNLLLSARVPGTLSDTIRQLELELLPGREMIAMAGREQAAANGLLENTLTSTVPDNIKAQYDRQQREDGSAQLDWLAHWDIPSARWWVTAYFRGLRTESEVYEAFRARNIPEELWADIFATEEELPPVWLIPDVVAAGVWTKEKAIPQLMKLGFSEENATVLYEYGYAKSKAGKAQTAADLQKVSLGNAKKMLEDGLVNAQQYEQILIDHGYSQEAASLTASLAQFEIAQTERKDRANLLLEEVKLGDITKSEAESALYNLGFNTGEIGKYLDKIEASRILNRKLPSETQVKDAYKKGLVTDAQAVAQLELLGYDQTWATIIFKTW